ncbi:MAG TPA: glycosyltransferase family 9 protein [Ignavibacteriaceae bacterium]|nr:glycosyltransferase family 9 protein [Ignavibacteriaceae bacterium]
MNSNIIKISKILTYLPLLISFKIKNAFSKKSENNEVLVIALSKIGDTIFLSFAISLLYKIYGERLTIFCYKHSETLLKEQLPNLRFLSIEVKDVIKGRFINKNVLKQINNSNPGKIYDLTGSIIAASILYYSKAKDIIGFNEKYFSYLYTKFCKLDNTPHLIDMYLKPVLKEFPDIKSIKEFRINFNPNDRILIFPFGGWAAKEWNIEKYILLQKELSKNYECKFIMEKNSYNSIFDIKNVILTNNIEELLNELKRCSLMISNDSGPLYIANMLGIPTFTIYGPTNPSYSLPFGLYHRFIQSNVHCIPKGNNQYCYTDAGRNGCKKFICMEELYYEQVYNKVLDFTEYLKINNKNEVVVQ